MKHKKKPVEVERSWKYYASIFGFAILATAMIIGVIDWCGETGVRFITAGAVIIMIIGVVKG